MIGFGWTTPQLFVAAAVPAVVASIGVFLIGWQAKARPSVVNSEVAA